MSITIFGYSLMLPEENEMMTRETDRIRHGQRTAEAVRMLLPEDTEAQQAARVHDIMTSDEISEVFTERVMVMARHIQGSRRNVLKKVRMASEPGKCMILADFYDQLKNLDEILNREGDSFWIMHDLDQEELWDFCSSMEDALSEFALRNERARGMYIEAEDIMDDIFSRSYAGDDGLTMYREYFDGRCYYAGPDDPMWIPAPEGICRDRRIPTAEADRIIDEWYSRLMEQDEDSCSQI